MLRNMQEQCSSRREFFIRSLSGISSAWLALHWPAVLAAHEHARAAASSPTPQAFQFFSVEQAAEVDPAAAQIIPTDETPGAHEAQVVYFIDRALVTFDRDKQAGYSEGLKELQAKTVEMFPPAAKFSSLASAEQVKVLQAIEKSEFFEILRLHTIMGFLASPEYGGNYQQVGWKLIGFENKPVYTPPFGYYDAEYDKSH